MRWSFIAFLVLVLLTFLTPLIIITTSFRSLIALQIVSTLFTVKHFIRCDVVVAVGCDLLWSWLFCDRTQIRIVLPHRLIGFVQVDLRRLIVIRLLFVVIWVITQIYLVWLLLMGFFRIVEHLLLRNLWLCIYFKKLLRILHNSTRTTCTDPYCLIR